MKRKTMIIILIIGIVLLLISAGAYFYNQRTESNEDIPPLIGGCAGVASVYTQECCDNWARENNIVKIQCVGNWVIKDNDCSWQCS